MKRALLTLAIGLGLLAGDAHARGGGGIRRIRETLLNVLDDARDESGECRRAVVTGLEDLRDRLDDIDGRRRKMKVALRALKDVETDAADDCPKSIRKGLRLAIDLLTDALESARDDDDDGGDGRDRDRDRNRDRDRDRDGDDRRRRVDCWMPQDPGCYNTKGGNPPMGRAAFEGVRSSVAAMKPNVFTMLDALRAAMQNRYLTSMQLVVLVRLFKPSVFQMLDVVKLCAPWLVDPQNGQGVSVEFQPNVFQARDAAAIIGAQRGDQ